MLRYLKNIFQLMLSPTKGWEDISADMTDVDELSRRGYYILIAIASLSELVRPFYERNLSWVVAVESAVALAGSYFVAVFIGRQILETYLKPLVDGDINTTRINIFAIYTLGLLLIIEIIDNLLPTELTLVKFLPLFVALIIYKATLYMAVKPDHELRFLCISVAALIVVPIGLFAILQMIIG